MWVFRIRHRSCLPIYSDAVCNSHSPHHQTTLFSQLDTHLDCVRQDTETYRTALIDFSQIPAGGRRRSFPHKTCLLNNRKSLPTVCLHRRPTTLTIYLTLNQPGGGVSLCVCVCACALGMGIINRRSIN